MGLFSSKERKLYINLVPITQGGGLQNALSFINSAGKLCTDFSNITVLFKEHMVLADLCEKYGIPYETVGRTPWHRIKFELFRFLKVKNALIFTLFGGRPIVCPGCMTVVGCAYSNLFYPDMHFWILESRARRFKLWLIDSLRLYLTRTATVVIFETEVLRERAIQVLGFLEPHTYVVPMAVGDLVRKFVSEEVTVELLRNVEVFRILYLGHSQPNKRQHLLARIARSMIETGFDNFKFIVTMEPGTYRDFVVSEIERFEVGKWFDVIERIPEHSISDTIKSCHAMINIAQLESFSNNYVEAWYMNKLLIATDADWARSSAGDAALYIDPVDAEASALALSAVLRSPEMMLRHIEKGKAQLRCHPTPEEKTLRLFEILSHYRGEQS